MYDPFANEKERNVCVEFQTPCSTDHVQIRAAVNRNMFACSHTEKKLNIPLFKRFRHAHATITENTNKGYFSHAREVLVCKRNRSIPC